jgi:hypothetical protein
VGAEAAEAETVIVATEADATAAATEATEAIAGAASAHRDAKVPLLARGLPDTMATAS